MMYKVVLDSNSKIKMYGPNVLEYDPYIAIGNTVVLMEEDDLLIAITPIVTNIQKKAKELSTCAEQYHAYITELQMSWLSATVFDGITEIEKKEQIQLDLSDVKAQYLSDVEAIKLKYSEGI